MPLSQDQKYDSIRCDFYYKLNCWWSLRKHVLLSIVTASIGLIASIMIANTDVIATLLWLLLLGLLTQSEKGLSAVTSTTDLITFTVSNCIAVIASGLSASRFTFSHLTGITECGVTAGRGTTSGAIVWINIALGSGILSSDWQVMCER